MLHQTYIMNLLGDIVSKDKSCSFETQSICKKNYWDV